MYNFLSYLLEPFQYEFMQRALIVALFGGIVCAILSCYLILKGWALMGDAISHAVVPGIALIYLIGLPLSIGAFIAGMICALFSGYIKDNSRLKEDTAMGIVFSGMFALGIALISIIKTQIHLSHILFGNILGITQADFYQVIIVSTIAFMILLIKRKDFLIYCFDPIHTIACGFSLKWTRYTLLGLLSLTIVSAIQSVGVILVVAMLITPGITAYVCVKDFNKMILIAVCSVIFSSISGIIISFHINGSTGACIVLVQATVFILCFIGSYLKIQIIKHNILKKF